MSKDFDQRASSYIKALTHHPEARTSEHDFLLSVLKPKPGMKVLDLGCGSGYLTIPVADRVCPKGLVYASDISHILLKYVASLQHPCIRPILNTEKKIPLSSKTRLDGVYSFTAFHHFDSQLSMIKECSRVLKPGGCLVICDIFQNTPVARYADDLMAKYSSTGHEAKFLSIQYIETLCSLGGFYRPRLFPARTYRKFKSMKEIGIFFKTLHSLRCSQRVVIAGLKKHVGITKKNGIYLVPWRIDCAIASKRHI